MFLELLLGIIGVNFGALKAIKVLINSNETKLTINKNG